MRPSALALLTACLASGLLPDAAGATQPLQAQLCRGRTPCKIAKIYPAGRARNGEPLRVVELALDRKNPDGGFACRPHQREFWRVIGPANRTVAVRLMRLCNDGYGAAGVGEDLVSVTHGRLIHVRYGGSAWRWRTTTLVALDPLRVLRRENCSYHNISVGFSMTTWDWPRFRGRQVMQFKPGGQNQELGCAPKQAEHRFPLLPMFRRGVGLAPKAAPALGGCSLEAREDGVRGHVVFGKPVGIDAGARLRVLAIGPRTLLITVDDTEFGVGADWTGSDHVQIWQGGLMSIDPEMLTSGGLVQVGIRAADGKLFPGQTGKQTRGQSQTGGKADGKPPAMPKIVTYAIDKRPGGVTLRLRVEMPRDLHAVTVGYGKSQAGRRFRLTATSPLVYGKARTLGGVYAIPEGAAVCAVKKGRLEVVKSGAADTLLGR